MSFQLKRGFWRSDFLLKYHQNPQVLERRSIEKKEKERKKKEKERKRLQESPNKREVNIFIIEKHFNFKNIFWCDSIFSPSIIPFQKPFPKSLRKFS
jgi:hypothetical protein